MRRPLKIPLTLKAVAVSIGLSACGNGNHKPAPGPCPADYYCDSDAARAFDCTDAGAANGYVSDFGACYPPV